MNEEARAELDRILALEPAALTEGDRAFLHARRSYLTEEQRVTFGLTEDASASDEDVSADSEQSRARKSKKAADSE